MTEITLDEFLRDNHDTILVAVQARMRGDEQMGAVAVQRELRENDLASQVLGFWLQAIRTDIELGSTAALEQNLQWLVRLRSGHDLPFDDALVWRIFADLSDEIDARLDSDLARRDYTAYREKVGKLIAEAFPVAQGGAS
jgi:hypothetical protein